MVASELTVDRAILNGVGAHIEGLKKTAEGAVLYSLIARSLQRYQKGGRDLTFIGILNALLRNYTQDPNADPATRFRARLIRQRLALHLPANANDSGLARTLASPAPQEITAPLPNGTSSRKNNSADVDQNAQCPPAPEMSLMKAAVASRNATLRADTDHKAYDMQGLRGDLEQLLRAHQQLGANLQRTHEYLSTIESDRVQLRNQLLEARTRALIDELTGLPNKAAFMRQLESETARSRRHGSHVAVALFAINDFESFTDKRGRELADSVISRYAAGAVQQFRGYDVVARYDNSRFAVLLPGTNEVGAFAALEKLRKHFAPATSEGAGGGGPVPAFSAVIASPLPGETPAALLRRAEEGLTELCRDGAGRIKTLGATAPA